MTNGYKWLDVKNIKVGDEYFIIQFGFLNESLDSVTFVVDRKKNDLVESRINLSEKNDRAKELDYRSWICNKVGREGQFSWGSIEAVYDSKGGGSSIHLRYSGKFPE